MNRNTPAQILRASFPAVDLTTAPRVRQWIRFRLKATQREHREYFMLSIGDTDPALCSEAFPTRFQALPAGWQRSEAPGRWLLGQESRLHQRLRLLARPVGADVSSCTFRALARRLHPRRRVTGSRRRRLSTGRQAVDRKAHRGLGTRSAQDGLRPIAAPPPPRLRTRGDMQAEPRGRAPWDRGAPGSRTQVPQDVDGPPFPVGTSVRSTSKRATTSGSSASSCRTRSERSTYARPQPRLTARTEAAPPGAVSISALFRVRQA